MSQEVPRELSFDFVKNLNFSQEFPIDFKQIAKFTSKDEVILTIIKYMREGWPERMEKRFRDIYSLHRDLEEVVGCVLFQDRVIIPEAMKDQILKLLHKNHSGISKIKQLARRAVYWYGTHKEKIL